jgi:hypothetical protein
MKSFTIFIARPLHRRSLAKNTFFGNPKALLSAPYDETLTTTRQDKE